MPNIKSKKKRVITNKKRSAASKSEKTELKSSIKKVLVAVEAKDKEAAATAYNEVSKHLDESVSSNIHHKNYAARQKSRLSKAVNSI